MKEKYEQRKELEPKERYEQKYDPLEIEVIEFETEDIITTSPGEDEGEDMKI